MWFVLFTIQSNSFFAFDSTTSTESGGRSIVSRRKNKRLAIRMPNIFCFQHSIPFQ